ncbi:hypothetical protein QYF36_015055 [Acer negundo]|nr:hypothetical protein QYF36_015055 [Acer negundo]
MSKKYFENLNVFVDDEDNDNPNENFYLDTLDDSSAQDDLEEADPVEDDLDEDEEYEEEDEEYEDDSLPPTKHNIK